MQKAIIQLAYRQIIDSSCDTFFEKKVLQLSFDEYKMKSQAYNTDGTIATFTDLKAKDGRANSLHYKSGFAIGNLVDSLNYKIPGLLDALGKPIEFTTHQFEVIESDITDMLAHKVAIHYITGWLTLFEIIGNTLLLSKENNLDAGFQKPVETFLLSLQPGVSIINYQEIPVFRQG